MDRPDGAVELGSFVLFLPSPTPGSTRCLVMAHGALAPGKFEPTPVRLHFFARNGVTLKGASPIELVERLRHRNQDPPEMIPAGGYYPDLDLSKLLGRGGEAHTYEDIANYQKPILKRQWECPHVALVRHRRFRSKTILLSEMIRLVTAHDGNITDIYVAACRPYVRAEAGERVGVDEFAHIPGQGGRRGAVVGWHRKIA